MELNDMHHPSCKLNQSRQGSFENEDGLVDEEDDDRSPLHHSHPSGGGGAGFNGGGGHHNNHYHQTNNNVRRDSDLSEAYLSPEAYRATQAVEFIAEHLRNEDEYVQVGATKIVP